MAQILVVNENFCWYQAIASLDNYYEIEIEEKLLKHADDVFSGYFAIKGKFTFGNSYGNRSDPDIILISKEFDKWILLEVELTSKSLSHTKFQLGVFSDAKYDIDGLFKYCLAQNTELGKFEKEIKTLFKEPPEVLVVFDSYHEKKLNELRSLFRRINICVFEVYKTTNHDFETYRLSGDYPYIRSGYSFLKASDFEIYEIARPSLFEGILPGKLELLYKMTTITAILMVSKSRSFLKIPRNPFSPRTTLTVAKTYDNKFLLDTLN